MTCASIFFISSCVRTFFLTSSLFDEYGRPAMILSAVASSTPGSFMSSSLLAAFRSTLCEVDLDEL